MANLLIFLLKLLTLCLGSAEITAELRKFPAGGAVFARSEASRWLLCLCYIGVALKLPRLLFSSLCRDQRVPASQISNVGSINNHPNVLKNIQKWSPCPSRNMCWVSSVAFAVVQMSRNVREPVKFLPVNVGKPVATSD